MLKDTLLKTRDFSLDRKSYLKARLSDVALEGLKRFVPLWVFLAIAYFFLGDYEWFGRAIIPTFAVSVLLFAFVLLLIWQKVMDKSLIPRMAASRFFEVSEEEIYAKVDGVGESRYTWALITRLAILPGWTFLMHGAAVGVAIPDRAFQNERDRTIFQDIARKKLLDQKRQRK